MIPTDGRPHLPKNIHQWMGDSVGHWEGNTLVIDTTNFTDLNPFPGAQNLHVIERITRADEDTILYEFTVEDPGMWTKLWSGEVPIKKISGQSTSTPAMRRIMGWRIPSVELAWPRRKPPRKGPQN